MEYTPKHRRGRPLLAGCSVCGRTVAVRPLTIPETRALAADPELDIPWRTFPHETPRTVPGRFPWACLGKTCTKIE